MGATSPPPPTPIQFPLRNCPANMRLTPQFMLSQGKKLAIVTSCTWHTAEIFTKSLGIFDYFDVLLAPQSTTKQKPHLGVRRREGDDRES